MTTVRRANVRTERESSEMTTVFLLFSLLTPDGLQTDSNELFLDSTEPQSDTIQRMLAKYDAEYEYELALEAVTTMFE